MKLARIAKGVNAMNSSKFKNKICACCGQDIVIPNEFTSLDVPTVSRLILFKLVRAMPNTVAHEMLSDNRPSLHVQICRLNAALRDIGSCYVIENEMRQGYYLNTKRRKTV